MTSFILTSLAAYNGSDRLHVARHEPEWELMWHWLHELTGDVEDKNPDSGDCWEYTGTCVLCRDDDVEVLVHEFRHRDRPVGCREIPGASRSHGEVYLKLAASWDYSGQWNRPVVAGSVQG